MHMNPFGMFGRRSVLIAVVIVAAIVGYVIARRKD